MNLERFESKLPTVLKKPYLLAKKLIEDILDSEVNYYAASLSFYTLFAIIPLLLITLSVVTSLPSFGEYYDRLKSMILNTIMPTQTELISKYLDTFINNSFKLGVMGLSYIMLTSILFFKNYEYIISKIFRTKPRGFWESISIYWTMITLIPVGIILSIYLSSYIQVEIDKRLDGSIDFLKIVPYIINWALFFAVYKISADKKISNISAIISALSASLLWSLLKNAFVYYVFYNKAYTSIYGSFSIILFLMLWIYLSWIILLYGFKLCAKLNMENKNDERE